jgi:hypothetical protein
MHGRIPSCFNRLQSLTVTPCDMPATRGRNLELTEIEILMLRGLDAKAALDIPGGIVPILIRDQGRRPRGAQTDNSKVGLRFIGNSYGKQ